MKDLSKKIIQTAAYLPLGVGGLVAGAGCVYYTFNFALATKEPLMGLAGVVLSSFVASGGAGRFT